MDGQRQHLTYSGKAPFLLALLIVAGLAGNVFSLRIVTGFDYLFGSIAVLLTVRLFGMRWGVLAAVVASSWSMVLFGHPYAMVWLCGEAIFVGLLLKRGRTRNIILYDSLYWPLVGAPLIWLIFRYVMNVPLLASLDAMLTFWMTGITNSLISTLLLTNIPRLASAGDPANESSIPIHQLIFNLLMAFVLLPTMVIVVMHDKDEEGRYFHEMYEDIGNSSRTVLYETRLKLHKLIATMNELSRLSEKLDLNATGEKVGQLQMAVEFIQNANPDFHAIYIGNAAGRSIARSPAQDARGKSIVNMDFGDREYFKAVRKTLRPVVSEVLMTRGGDTVPSVVIAVPFISGGTLHGYAAAGVRVDILKELLLKSRAKPYHEITLLDRSGKVITSTRETLKPLDAFESCSNGSLSKAAAKGIQRCMPGSSDLAPFWQRVQKSTYLLSAPMDDETSWVLEVEAPFDPYQSNLLEERIKSLLVALSLAMLALVTSLSTARRIAAPLRRLSQATTDLPGRLLREKINIWPESRVDEIDQLIGNFRTMATALGQYFHEITFANETLERRVGERTKELTGANEELQREITERKATELQRDHLMDELVRQVHFLQTMIDAIPNPIFFKDTAGRYQGCNNAFEECLGFTRDGVVGKTVHELFPQQMAGVFHKADQDLFERRGVQVYETSMRYADGLTHEIVFYKATYDDADGNPGGLVGTIIDITWRKKAETERDQLLLELKQKNKELEGIVYVASHDLRSPLVNVQGFSRKLAKNCAELDAVVSGPPMDEAGRAQVESILRERIPKSLGFITSSIEKMDGLLNGLLRLSRLGRAALCFDTLDMEAILTKIVSSMAYQIETSGARVDMGPLEPCLGDGVQVTQVFSNLLDNALKYRSPDRPLVVRVSSEGLPCCIRYTVEDNGMGIPGEQQDHVWEIFHRLNPGESEGEGLGLTLSRRIVDRLGGSIWLESDPDVGSRFHVELPRPPGTE